MHFFAGKKEKSVNQVTTLELHDAFLCQNIKMCFLAKFSLQHLGTLSCHLKSSQKKMDDLIQVHLSAEDGRRHTKTAMKRCGADVNHAQLHPQWAAIHSGELSRATRSPH